MENVVYTTRFDKPIYEGSTYVAVLRDNSIITTTAVAGEDDPNIVERFLTRAGAVKFVKKNAAKPLVPKETKEQLEEKRLSAMNEFQQLLEVKSKEDWDKWVKRNALTISGTASALVIRRTQNKAGHDNTLISWNWNMHGTPSCCGGKEQGSHSGSMCGTSSKHFSEEVHKILVKYLIVNFENAMRIGAKNYGVVSYVVSPESITGASARIGRFLDASSLFVKSGRFINPNTKRPIDMYAVTDKWSTNDTTGGEDEFLTDDDDEDNDD